MNGTNQLSCTLVVPCHNERERLDLEAFRVAEQEFPWLRLLFVDDGSTDGTAEVLQGFRVSQLDKRQGKAGAAGTAHRSLRRGGVAALFAQRSTRCALAARSVLRSRGRFGASRLHAPFSVLRGGAPAPLAPQGKPSTLSQWLRPSRACRAFCSLVSVFRSPGRRTPPLCTSAQALLQ